MSATISRVKQVAVGGGLGLLAGLSGAAVCSGLFVAIYHPHSGGDIGDWTFLAVAMFAFGGGLPLGAIVGVGWAFTSWPRKFLFAAMAAAGVVAATLALVFTSS